MQSAASAQPTAAPTQVTQNGTQSQSVPRSAVGTTGSPHGDSNSAAGTQIGTRLRPPVGSRTARLWKRPMAFLVTPKRRSVGKEDLPTEVQEQAVGKIQSEEVGNAMPDEKLTTHSDQQKPTSNTSVTTSGSKTGEIPTSGKQKSAKELPTSGKVIRVDFPTGGKSKIQPIESGGKKESSIDLPTGGKKTSGEKPPKPSLPSGVQAEMDWRESTHKSGSSFTLLFRPYKMVDGKKKRLPSSYVFYIDVRQWERLKRYEPERRKNYVQADFNDWWRCREEEAAPGATRAAC
jgi:hypothetical protein